MCLAPSQILKASQINAKLRGFGISFSRSLDVDNNGYPDFAVGAHKSNQAVLLRSQPIVKYQVESPKLKSSFIKYFIHSKRELLRLMGKTSMRYNRVFR